MMKLKYLYVFLFCFAAECVCAAPSAPNLVLVFPDQMRTHAMGFWNTPGFELDTASDPVKTPHLDRFAKESLVLKYMISNYPVCSPFRGMLMTGKWPHANKVLSNCNSKTTPYHVELQESDRCWSDVLKNKGYSLGYIGKWHLDAPHEPYVESYNNNARFAWNEWCSPGRRHGFDFWHAYGTFDRHMEPEYWTTDMTRDERLKVKKWGPIHETEQAVNYIRNEGGTYRENGKPFALVVSMNPPHTPYGMVPEKYKQMYADVPLEILCNRPNIPGPDTKMGKAYRRDIRNYLAMVTGVDEQFGRIVSAIDEVGLGRDTIIAFTADHGNCLGIHHMSTKNNRYDESMRIPFLLRWKGRIKPRVDDVLVSVPDIYPTLLGLMGFKSDIPKDVTGVNRSAMFLTGKGDRPEAALYMKVPVGEPAMGQRGVRTHRYMLHLGKKKDGPLDVALYDGKNDPYQLKNVAKDKPEVVKRLVREELVPMLKENKDPWLKGVELP